MVRLLKSKTSEEYWVWLRTREGIPTDLIKKVEGMEGVEEVLVLSEDEAKSRGLLEP